MSQPSSSTGISAILGRFMQTASQTVRVGATVTQTAEMAQELMNDVRQRLEKNHIRGFLYAFGELQKHINDWDHEHLLYLHLTLATESLTHLFVDPKNANQAIQNYEQNQEQLKQLLSEKHLGNLQNTLLKHHRREDHLRLLENSDQRMSDADRNTILDLIEKIHLVETIKENLQKQISPRHQNYANPLLSALTFLQQYQQIIIDMINFQEIMEGKQTPSQNEFDAIRDRFIEFDIKNLRTDLQQLFLMQTMDHGGAAQFEAEVKELLQQNVFGSNSSHQRSTPRPPIEKSGDTIRIHYAPLAKTPLTSSLEQVVSGAGEISNSRLTPLCRLYDILEQKNGFTEEEITTNLAECKQALRSFLGKSPSHPGLDTPKKFIERLKAIDQELTSIPLQNISNTLLQRYLDASSHVEKIRILQEIPLENRENFEKYTKLLVERNYLYLPLQKAFPFFLDENAFFTFAKSFLQKLDHIYTLVKDFEQTFKGKIAKNKEEYQRLQKNISDALNPIHQDSFLSQFRFGKSGREPLIPQLEKWAEDIRKAATKSFVPKILRNDTKRQTVDLTTPPLERIEGKIVNHRKKTLWDLIKDIAKGKMSLREISAKKTVIFEFIKFSLIHELADNFSDIHHQREKETIQKKIERALQELSRILFSGNNENLVQDMKNCMKTIAESLGNTTIDINRLLQFSLGDTNPSLSTEQIDTKLVAKTSSLDQKLKEYQENKTKVSLQEQVEKLSRVNQALVMKKAFDSLAKCSLGNFHEQFGAIEQQNLNSQEKLKLYQMQLKTAIRKSEKIGWFKKRFILLFFPIICYFIKLFAGKIFEGINRLTNFTKMKQFEEKKEEAINISHTFVNEINGLIKKHSEGKDAQNPLIVTPDLETYIKVNTKQVPPTEQLERFHHRALGKFSSIEELDRNFAHTILRDTSLYFKTSQLLKPFVDRALRWCGNSFWKKFLCFPLFAIHTLWRFTLGGAIETFANLFIRIIVSRLVKNYNITDSLIKMGIDKLSNVGFTQTGSLLQNIILQSLEKLQESLHHREIKKRLDPESLKKVRGLVQSFQSLSKLLSLDSPQKRWLYLSHKQNAILENIEETIFSGISETVLEGLNVFFTAESFQSSLAEICGSLYETVLDIDKPVSLEDQYKDTIGKYFYNTLYISKNAHYPEETKRDLIKTAKQQLLTELKSLEDHQEWKLKIEQLLKDIDTILERPGEEPFIDYQDIIIRFIDENHLQHHVYPSLFMKQTLETILKDTVHNSLKSQILQTSTNELLNAEIRKIQKDFTEEPTSFYSQMKEKMRIIQDQQTSLDDRWKAYYQMLTKIKTYQHSLFVSLLRLGKDPDVISISLDMHKKQIHEILEAMYQLEEGMANHLKDFHSAKERHRLFITLTTLQQLKDTVSEENLQEMKRQLPVQIDDALKATTVEDFQQAIEKTCTEMDQELTNGDQQLDIILLPQEEIDTLITEHKKDWDNSLQAMKTAAAKIQEMETLHIDVISKDQWVIMLENEIVKRLTNRFRKALENLSQPYIIRHAISTFLYQYLKT